jgi:hypothetical protein
VQCRPVADHLRITNLINRHYIGADLTQAEMEQFFRTDEYFVDSTLGWFERNAVED